MKYNDFILLEGHFYLYSASTLFYEQIKSKELVRNTLIKNEIEIGFSLVCMIFKQQTATLLFCAKFIK